MPSVSLSEALAMTKERDGEDRCLRCDSRLKHRLAGPLDDAYPEFYCPRCNMEGST